MDIQFINKFTSKSLSVAISNPKDGLFMAITNFKVLGDEPSNQHFYVSVYDSEAESPETQVWSGEVQKLFKGYYKDEKQSEINLTKVHLNAPIDIYGHTMYHSVNMLRGFFSSKKWKRYASMHGKRAKLLAKKHALSRQMSSIDKQLADLD